MRPSASAGSLPSSALAAGIGDPMHDGASGACVYLQKLPPVLRRSVCGTGTRQHTRAVYVGERERDGTPLLGAQAQQQAQQQQRRP